MNSTVQAITTTIEKRDPYTSGHQQRVADLSRTIAREIGLSENEIEGIYIAAAIHDIGKISLPAEILSKPVPLSDIEISLIQAHSQTGYDILKGIKFPGRLPKSFCSTMRDWTGPAIHGVLPGIIFSCGGPHHRRCRRGGDHGIPSSLIDPLWELTRRLRKLPKTRAPCMNPWLLTPA